MKIKSLHWNASGRDFLISTLDEVMKIQEDGHQKRRAAKEELNRMEQELKDKLLEIRR